MANIAKISLIFNDTNTNKGHASESWFIPYSNDKDSVATANTLAQPRANLLGYGVTLDSARITVYTVGNNLDPTALVRVKTLPTVGLGKVCSDWTGYGPTTAKAWFASASMRSVAKKITVTFASGQSSNIRMFGVPQALTWDLNAPVWQVSGADTQALYALFALRLKSYSNALVGGAVFHRLTSLVSKTAISGVSTDDSGNVCVVINGASVAGTFPPGTVVKIGGRHSNRTGNYAKHDSLNGVHRVLSSTYNSTANTTTICLTCTRWAGLVTGCEASQGFIYLFQHSQQPLLPIGTGTAALNLGAFTGVPRRGHS